MSPLKPRLSSKKKDYSFPLSKFPPLLWTSIRPLPLGGRLFFLPVSKANFSLFFSRRGTAFPDSKEFSWTRTFNPQQLSHTSFPLCVIRVFFCGLFFLTPVAFRNSFFFLFPPEAGFSCNFRVRDLLFRHVPPTRNALLQNFPPHSGCVDPILFFTPRGLRWDRWLNRCLNTTPQAWNKPNPRP